MKYIYKDINAYVDKVYITSIDNGKMDPQELIDNQIKELNKAKDEILSNIYELFNKYSKLAYDLAENLVLEKSK